MVQLQKEDELVGYIREDGNQVFSIPLHTHNFTPIKELVFWNESGLHEQFLIYDFSQPNNHFYFEFPQGVKYQVGFNINSIEEIQNNGTTYNEWQTEYDGIINESLLETPLATKFTYAEGVGITKSFNLSMLFYMPWETAVAGGYDYQNPTLRYVADGPDNTIIYEGIGGKKLWEEELSVDNITVDSDMYEIEWYTIKVFALTVPLHRESISAGKAA